MTADSILLNVEFTVFRVPVRLELMVDLIADNTEDIEVCMLRIFVVTVV